MVGVAAEGVRRGAPSPWWRRWGWTAAAAAAAVGLRLPHLSGLPGSDEAGLLIVAQQWPDGSGSVYGSYFVDRSPLLIGVFWLAESLGGLVALRLLACLAAAGAVVAAAALGRQVSGETGARWSAVAAAALLSTPLFDLLEVTQELLAAPFVLVGVWALLAAGPRAGAGTGSTSMRSGLLLLAGAMGAAAFGMKQSFLDVPLAAVVIGVLGLSAGRRVAPVLRDAAWFALGAVTLAGAVLACAAAVGSSPGAVFDAVVTFRLQATGVIADSAPEQTLGRALRFPGALLGSGAALVAFGLAVRLLRGPRDPAALVAVTLLVWQGFVVVAGGSYWMHYLLGLVPGLVVAVAALAADPSRLRHVVRWGVVQAAVVTVVVGSSLAVVPQTPRDSSATGLWLAEQVRPGDTATVLYGQPDILHLAGVTSPYEHLWSLPKRVLDPELRDLTAVLSGPDAPTWVLVREDLETWAVEEELAAGVLSRRYRSVARLCGYTVLLRQDVDRVLSDGWPLPCAAAA